MICITTECLVGILTGVVSVRACILDSGTSTGGRCPIQFEVERLLGRLTTESVDLECPY